MNVPALSRFRSDIEGLRAVAVLLVLFFHAGLPPHGGYIGVDIFFVISGFLITGLLLREAESSGRISLSNFYARRAKRLLPAATLVLLTSTVLIQFRAPESQRAIFNLDVVGAAAYFVNWRFAARSVDYLAEDLGRSPILHFWSLAVEEQFYFIWPLLIIASLYLAKKFGARRSVATTSALCLVLVPSLAWSVWYTKVSPAEAFFVTSTRLWELSAGALLALYQARIKQLPHALSSILGWGGVLLISVAAVMFNEKTVWPSYRAGLPTLGTALVIASGTISKEGRLYRLLSLRPMVWIGAISYSLYLWHWPLVVLGQDWLELKGRMWGGALVVASFVPALLSYHFVEQPTRRAPILDKLPAFALSLGFNLSLVSIVAGLVLASLSAEGSAPAGGQAQTVELAFERGQLRADPPGLGAGALGGKPKNSPAGVPQKIYHAMTPSPARATGDIPEAYALGCQARFQDAVPKWCEIGDPKGSVDAVVLGDSKILQYYDALDAAGQSLGWRIRTATKSSCAFTGAMTMRAKQPYRECAEFRKNVLRELQKSPPDVVITSQNGSTAYLEEKGDAEPTRDGMTEGLVDVWSQLTAWGTQVVVVLDNPQPPSKVIPVYDCLLRYPADATNCTFDRKAAQKASAESVQRAAAMRVSGVTVIDLSPLICPADRCAPVIGEVLIYRQGSHITNTYARTLAPALSRRFQSAYKPKR